MNQPQTVKEFVDTPEVSALHLFRNVFSNYGNYRNDESFRRLLGDDAELFVENINKIMVIEKERFSLFCRENFPKPIPEDLFKAFTAFQISLNNYEPQKHPYEHNDNDGFEMIDKCFQKANEVAMRYQDVA